MIEQMKGRISLHLALTVFLGFGMVLFGVLAVAAYTQRSHALNTVDQQVSAAQNQAKTDQKKADDAANAKANELPYKTYVAEAEDGAFQLQFPKNWSVYAEHSTPGSGTQLLLIAGLDWVNVNKSGINTQIFKLELMNTQALDVVKSYQSRVKQNKLTSTTIHVSGIAATEFSGLLDDQRHNGLKVVVPVRDKAMVFTTESQTNLTEFNQILTTAKIIP